MRDNIGDVMSDPNLFLCRINCSSFKLHIRLAAHGSGSDKGMQSPLIKDYCLLQSTTENKYLSSHSISDNLDMRILNEAMKTYPCRKGFLFDGFRKTMVQTQKLDEMLERQRVKIGNVFNLAIDVSISEASNSDPVPMEPPNFGERENIKDEENWPKKVVTLPDHLILDQILPRLPVKPLHRFKSVCRDWCSTISTPEFEKSRLAFSGSHHQFVLLKDNGWFSPSIINNPNYLIIQESYKYNDKYHLSSVIGCCNGLVGFSTNISHGVSKFIVLNPATRQQVEILGPDDSTGFNSRSCRFWFGYVSSVDDYYIVAFYSSGDEFWTFSWKSGIWKRNLCILNRNARKNEQIRVAKPALINDSLYWPIDIWDFFRGIGTEIVEINLVTEKHEVKPRMNFSICHVREIALVNLEGCLALHTTSIGGRLDVWMLRQAGDWNSWEMVYSQVLRHCHLIYYSTTGKLLVGHGKLLKSVDDLSQLQSLEQVSDGQSEIRSNSLLFEYDGVGDYVESLIWPFRRSRPNIMHRCKHAINLAVLKIRGQLSPKHRA